MAERPGELIQNSESLEKSENADTGLKPRTANSISEVEKVTASAATDDTASEPEEIKEQIEQTRNQMTETINAIEEKLSFENISNQVSEQFSSAVQSAKHAAYDAAINKAEKIMKKVNTGLSEVSETAGEVGTYVVETARRNPLPFALIGLGVGMLLVQKSFSGNSKGKKHYKSNSGNSTYRQIADTSSHALSTAQRKVGNVASSAYDSVSSAAGTAYDSVSDVASSAYEGATSAANSAYEGISSAAGSAYQGVSSFASATGDQFQNVAKKAQHQYETTLEENPLALGAIALAVGAVVGLSIPGTEYEDNLMGETKQNLVHTVEDSARDAFSRVQEVAGEFTKTASEQVKAKANG